MKKTVFEFETFESINWGSPILVKMTSKRLQKCPSSNEQIIKGLFVCACVCSARGPAGRLLSAQSLFQAFVLSRCRNIRVSCRTTVDLCKHQQVINKQTDLHHSDSYCLMKLKQLLLLNDYRPLIGIKPSPEDVQWWAAWTQPDHLAPSSGVQRRSSGEK